MKYKVVDYIDNEATEEITGTCELCFGRAFQNNDVLIVEDEKGERIEVELNEWDWGDLTNYYIDNLIEFSNWLSKKEFDCKLDSFGILDAIDNYYEEKESN